MKSANDYRKRAQECVELAQKAPTREQRTMLLHIAETWLRLAEDRLDKVDVMPVSLSKAEAEPTPTLN